MSDLFRLVYASKNLLKGAEPEARGAVETILDASRRNNARVGVTGALMFNDGAFAQVLEGPQKGVEDTFERIQRDQRHGDVTVLECRPVTERGFPEWSMAFVGRSASGQAVWNRLATESGFDLRRLDGDEVFSMLHGLVLEEEGIAAPSQPAPDPQPLPRILDTERLREEIAPLARPQGRPAPDPVPARSTSEAAAIAILKAALAEERNRTTALRGELDVLQVALAESRDGLEHMSEQRDLWRRRARALATALCQDDDEEAGGRASEPSAPARVVA